MGIKRLQNAGLFPIEAFAVISEEEMIPLCEKYGVKWVMYKNDPLGEKKNFGLSEAMNLEWDYLIEIGSDDILKTEYLHAIAPYLGVKEVLNISHVGYLNSEDGTCRKYQTKNRFGMGRAISRKVFERIGTKLWLDRINKGMDNNSNGYLDRRAIFWKRIDSLKPLGIDIKSAVNIWPFNYLTGVEWTLEEAIEGLSEQEITAIQSLIHVAV